MCIEISNNTEKASNASQKKVSYSIKKILKLLFKQPKCSKREHTTTTVAKEAEFVASLEFLENLRNADVESECTSLESYENEANERLSCEIEDYDFADISAVQVPVHFVRTENGVFFWSATPDVPVDSDLIEPLYCCTSNHIAVPQFTDRWAQA